jgi:hypothetical protein
VEVSPFPHQGPLEPNQVKGRDDLIADLTERITQRRVTALLGPRRFGKTSALTRVADDMARAGTSVVWVDLYEVTSTADLARRFDSALAATQGTLRSRLGTIAATVGLNLGFLRADFSRRRDERPDPDAVLATLVDTLVAGATDTPTVVMFDEFPGIDRVTGAAGLLRTKLQHHFQQIGLVFAGSQPSLMRAMFSQRARPFYAQADLVPIAPFSVAAVHDIVADGFHMTRRDPGDLPGAIFSFAGGHPYRTMQAADVAWRTTAPGAVHHRRIWDAALASLRAETDLANEAIFSGFATSEKAVLRLLAGGERLFGTAAELLGVSTGSAQTARDNLVAAGDLVITDERPCVVDPLLADWVRRRFATPR